ncbi:MAG: thioredoxin [Thermoleophilia bacterium]
MDSTEATFQQDVIERSHEVPVVVDFWAPWCGPCRQLAPLIEAAVDRHGDEVVLVKVNIDENPGLAQQYRVQSIPFVIAFKAGEPATQFVGMQPQPSVESFVNGLVPTKADRLTDAGDEASLREAIELDPGHTGARLSLARLLMADGRTDDMAGLLEPIAFDVEAAGMLARLALAGIPTRTSPPVSTRSRASATSRDSPTCWMRCGRPTANAATTSGRR